MAAKTLAKNARIHPRSMHIVRAGTSIVTVGFGIIYPTSECVLVGVQKALTNAIKKPVGLCFCI